jgi:hypothetical protein
MAHLSHLSALTKYGRTLGASLHTTSTLRGGLSQCSVSVVVLGASSSSHWHTGSEEPPLPLPPPAWFALPLPRPGVRGALVVRRMPPEAAGPAPASAARGITVSSSGVAAATSAEGPARDTTRETHGVMWGEPWESASEAVAAAAGALPRPPLLG